MDLAELEAGDPSEGAAIDLDEPRLIIPSSGTTQRPNLVSLDARALLYRLWPSIPAREHAACFLSWAPLDHVMGLALVSPNLPQKIYLSTARFIASPSAWLDAVEQFKVTHATMTNFGLSLLEKHVLTSPGRSWNLTELRKLGVGAESISPQLCKRVVQLLQWSGLREDAVILGYGLTECGPVVGGQQAFRPEAIGDTEPFVALDRPTRGHSVRITGKDSELVPEDTVGAVEVRGPSMTSGYFGDPEATARLFTADGWIRTGDLGSLRDGRLTITGREKEIIAIHAKKIPCLIIETAAEAVPGVKAAYAVSCKPYRAEAGLPGEMRFALFFETALTDSVDIGGCVRLVRIAMAKHFGAAPAYVVPVKTVDVPRTSGGKVQRLQLAARLESGAFDDILCAVRSSVLNCQVHERSVPETETEKRVFSAWKRVLGHDQFGIDDDFFETGGDSLNAVRLALELETIFKTSLPTDILIQNATIRRMATFFVGATGSNPTAAKDSLPATHGPTPLHFIEAKIQTFVADWPGERLGASGLMFAFNQTGAQRPVFWCLQTEQELTQLAIHLGADRPFYGMRSAHLAMTYTPCNIAALARRYVEDVLSIDPFGPYLIGGNCQGGLIAIEMARQIQRSGREVELLTLCDMPFWDSFKQESYRGRVALFAGVKSRLNPLRRFRFPELGYRKLLPEGVRFEVLPAEYGNFFKDDVVDSFIAKFLDAIQWAQGLRVGAVHVEEVVQGALPNGAYRVEIAAPEAAMMGTGQSVALKIRLKNIGSSTWGPTEETGIALGNHWVTERGEIIVWHDGHTPLLDPLSPGEECELTLPVRAPGVSGRYLLEIDLVEEGVTWFVEKGSSMPAWTKAIVIQTKLPKLVPFLFQKLIGALVFGKGTRRRMGSVISGNRRVTIQDLRKLRSRVGWPFAQHRKRGHSRSEAHPA